MNSKQKEQFLSYLNEHTQDNETILSSSFRILCFTHNKNRPSLDWIGTDQPLDSAPFQSVLVFPKLNVSYSFLMTIKELKKELEKLNVV